MVNLKSMEVKLFCWTLGRCDHFCKAFQSGQENELSGYTLTDTDLLQEMTDIRGIFLAHPGS